MASSSLLITGASGLVGSRFVELYRHKYKIYNLDLKTGVDITQSESIAQFIKSHPATALIHLAAFTNTGEAFKQLGNKDGSCYQVNVVGTRNIAAVCKNHGIHLVHISTDFVFDGSKKTPYLEDDPRTPIEWYGTTKALAEEEVEQSGVGYTIIRIAYPYRATFPDKLDLVAKLRAGIESGTLPPQFTDTIITPTFIDDIARGFDKVITHKPTGIFHFTGSTHLSPYDLACQVAAVYNLDSRQVGKGSLTAYLAKNPRPFARYSALSNAKAKSELGLDFVTIEQGLAAIKKQQESNASQA